MRRRCFNLVIEVLLISSGITGMVEHNDQLLFQSRNRGSFDFKKLRGTVPNLRR